MKRGGLVVLPIVKILATVTIFYNSLKYIMPYYVYVIELEKRVKKTRKFIKANPNIDLTKPCVYVGQSVRPPQKREKQHYEGHKSSWWVREFGIQLLPELFEIYNPLKTRAMAEKAERILTKHLRKEGYGVWSN